MIPKSPEVPSVAVQVTCQSVHAVTRYEFFGAWPADDFGYLYAQGDVAFGWAGSYGVPGPGQVKVLPGWPSPMSKARSTGRAVVVAEIPGIDAVAFSECHLA